MSLKVALVTTSPSVPSGIGDYTRHLLPSLRQHMQLELFYEPGAELAGSEGLVERSSADLDPRRFDRVLYQLGNMGAHAFMLPLLKSFGGIVMQHDWVLFDLAVGAHPGLARGGTKGALLAAREGGPKQLLTYLESFLARRQSKKRAPALPAGTSHSPSGAAELVFGWHEPEPNGRWVADHAYFSLPTEFAERVEILLSSRPGCCLTLWQGERLLARHDCTKTQPWTQLNGQLDPAGERVLRLSTDPVAMTPEQRRFGDSRRLGAHIERIRYGQGEQLVDLDLSQPVVLRMRQPSLADSRFELPLNRSVVGTADGFLVHSRYVGDRIRAARGPAVPIGLVHHGAERRWSDHSRTLVRRELGLPESWSEGLLVVSFGGVQAHKRIHKVLEGLRLARERRPGIHLAMVGAVDTEGFDARDEARRLGLGDAVHFRGYAPEAEVWQWLHAADVGVNLRGPTSGGTSGGIFQTLGLGRPVIVTDAAEQSELPDTCTLKVPLGQGEVEALADALVRLHDDPALRQTLEAAARRFVDQECHWSHCAKRYAEHLTRMPGPRKLG